ncbi:MAG: phage holin family protein [Polyangiaceae bacterium]|nr:phage holin family protein [Polyangiaceae bacterium]
MNPGSAEEPSLGTLFSELGQQTGKLVSHEIRLARYELKESVRGASRNIATIAAGGLAAMVGGLLLAIACTLLLAKLIPLWLSALVMAVLLVGAGITAVSIGLKALRTLDLAPRETVRTLKEDSQWLRAELSR